MSMPVTAAKRTAHNTLFITLYSNLPSILSIILAAGLYIVSGIRLPPSQNILSSHVAIFDMANSSLQKGLYFVCVATLLVATLFYLGQKKSRYASSRDSCRTHSLLDLLFFFSLFAFTNDVFFKSTFFFLIGACCLYPLGLRKLFSWSLQKNNAKRIVLSLAFLLYPIAFIVPVLFAFPVVDINYHVSHLAHHAATILPGVQFAREGTLSDSSSYLYGFLMPISVKIFHALSGYPLDNELITVKTTQFFQLLGAILTIGIGYVVLPPRIKFASIIFPLLLPWITMVHPSISHPNSAAIRYLPLLLFILSVKLCSLVRTKYSWLLAVLGGMILATNIELGVVCAAGTIAYFGFSSKPFLLGVAKALPKYFVCAIPAFAVTLFGYSYFLLDNQNSFASMLHYLFIFGVSGYGSVISQPSFVAIFSFYLFTTIVVSSVIQLSSNEVMDSDDTKVNPVACAYSAMGIVWLSYYMNRMGIGQLSLIIMLAILVVVENWSSSRPDLRACLDSRRSGQSYFSLYGVIFVLVLAYVSVRDTTSYALRYISNIVRLGCRHERVFASSQYCFEKSVSTRLSALNTQLFSIPQASRHKYMVLSPFHETSAYVYGFNATFPWLPTYIATVPSTLQNQRDWMHKQGPSVVLVAKAQSTDSKSIKARISHLTSIISYKGSRYYLSTVNDEWKVYKRSLQ